MMNNRAVGIGLFTLGLSLAVIFSNRTVGIIPGVIFMIIGAVFLVTRGENEVKID
jgi:hypothetical protein